jgi:hypothetical protein
MWRNPKYYPPEPQQQQTATAPEPSGKLLAAFPRRGLDGEQELRVVLDEYQQRPYVAIRLWTKDSRTGSWWPTKKGVSVRIAELEGVAEALVAALELAQETRPAAGRGATQ